MEMSRRVHSGISTLNVMYAGGCLPGLPCLGLNAASPDRRQEVRAVTARDGASSRAKCLRYALGFRRVGPSGNFWAEYHAPFAPAPFAPVLAALCGRQCQLCCWQSTGRGQPNQFGITDLVRGPPKGVVRTGSSRRRNPFASTPWTTRHRVMVNWIKKRFVPPKSPNFPERGLLRSGSYCGAALHRRYLMVLASAQLRVRPERKDGGHPALCNAPPQWLRMRHQSHQSHAMLYPTHLEHPSTLPCLPPM